MSKPPFQQLVDSYWRDVARLAYGLAGPEGDDIAQQAWTQALAAYPKLESTTNLRGWLLTITYRCAMDHFRRRQRTPILVDDLEAVGRPATVAAADDDLEDTELLSALTQLPQRERAAVCLRYLADQDHQAIARSLDVSLSMSRRLVSDGLKQLRKTYQAEGA